MAVKNDEQDEALGEGSQAEGRSGLDPFLAGLDYPMFIVTAVDPGTGERAGCLVGFSTQVSIGPERFLVCLSRRNSTHRLALRADVLAVHGPGRDQRELAALFGTRTGDEIDKFARCEWRAGYGGVPLLEACPRRFVGRVLERIPLGDHTGFVLDPRDVSGSAGQPLMFSDVRDLEAGHEA